MVNYKAVEGCTVTIIASFILILIKLVVITKNSHDDYETAAVLCVVAISRQYQGWLYARGGYRPRIHVLLDGSAVTAQPILIQLP